ncbi:MAG TPA: indole-3-glycerol phosphate synthase TrpC [Acidimicrobiales bacterium]|nr:indole-3-glycerol phosphate synthase TrpC [Acidimicrobiales bacterium]
MQTYLDKILDRTRDRVATSQRRRTTGDLERELKYAPTVRDFAGAITAPGMSLIAEVKRRSPSKGRIRDELNPAQVAASYEAGGARALSVLTEPEFFAGTLDDLVQAREATAIPVLRKDFVIDPYQVVEARVGGADAILLIVLALPDRGRFAELAAAAGELGMAALIEVHEERELDAAFAVADGRPSLIGVNQRDLTSFVVDRGLAIRLRPQIPPEVAMVAESGIADRSDVVELEEAGIEAILVGEALMRADDPGAAGAALLGGPPPEG